MTWIKLNDNVPRHPKVQHLSDRAFRAWIDGLCYASEFLTDGVLPPTFVVTFPQRILSELIESGLWKCPEDGRVHIHDYLQHQSSKADVMAEKARNRARRTGGTSPGVPEKYRDQRTENREQSTDKTNTKTGARAPSVKTKMTRFVSLGARK